MADVDPALTPVYELHLPEACEHALKGTQVGTELPLVWKQPTTQFSVSLVRDPQVKASWDQIRAQKPSILLTYELVWILLIWIFRAWRLQKSGTWLLRIWTQAWIAVLSVLGAVLVIPILAWGEPVQKLFAQVAKAFIQHFMT